MAIDFTVKLALVLRLVLSRAMFRLADGERHVVVEAQPTGCRTGCTWGDRMEVRPCV
jgi:hypothetical protein